MAGAGEEEGRHTDAAEEMVAAAIAPPARPHPPLKNKISVGRVEYFLSWEKPAYLDPEEDEDAVQYNETIDEMAVHQQKIKKEVEEKGYVHVPDDYEETGNRIADEAYREAYLEVFGTDPPAEYFARRDALRA